MSGFALRRNLELQLPTNFVEVESEEMEYIDGGYYLSYHKIVGIVQAVGLSGATVTAGVLAAQLGGATGLVASLIPGIGWAAAGVIAANATAFAWSCVNAIGRKKGVDIQIALPTGFSFTVK